jgi:LemA protein
VIIAAVLGAIVLVVLVAGVLSYNRFVNQRQLIDNAWANVETELRRRYDLIPNLVETVKGYAAHERSTLEAVVQARSEAVNDHGPPNDQAGSENVLVSALRGLLALSEAYPELKANHSFLELQQQLTITEDRIQAARRFYNNNVRDYNQRVQSVPSNLTARLFGFDAREYFNIDHAVAGTGAPSVAFGSGAAGV